MLITPIYALRAAMNTWLVLEIYAQFHESVSLYSSDFYRQSV